MNPNEYLLKKIYYLYLNSDGTYIQYIHLIPNDENQFKNVTLFTLTGKWYKVSLTADLSKEQLESMLHSNSTNMHKFKDLLIEELN